MFSRRSLPHYNRIRSSAPVYLAFGSCHVYTDSGSVLSCNPRKSSREAFRFARRFLLLRPDLSHDARCWPRSRGPPRKCSTIGALRAFSRRFSLAGRARLRRAVAFNGLISEERSCGGAQEFQGSTESRPTGFSCGCANGFRSREHGSRHSSSRRSACPDPRDNPASIGPPGL